MLNEAATISYNINYVLHLNQKSNIVNLVSITIDSVTALLQSLWQDTTACQAHPLSQALGEPV